MIGRLVTFLAAGILIAVTAVVFTRSHISPPLEHGAAGPTASPRAERVSTAEPGRIAVEATPGGAAPNPTELYPGPCGVYVDEALRSADFYTVGGLTSLSEAVITAEVMSVSEARWATPDGEPPSNEFGFVGTSADVYRFLELRILGVGKADDGSQLLTGDSISVRVLGGTIGCRTYMMSDDVELANGDDIVAFLGHQPPLSAVGGDRLDVIAVWKVVDGVVHTREGEIAPREILRDSITMGTE